MIIKEKGFIFYFIFYFLFYFYFYFRRQNREIEYLFGTIDGQNAIILCADGGVIFYSTGLNSNENNFENESEESEVKKNKIFEYSPSTVTASLTPVSQINKRNIKSTENIFPTGFTELEGLTYDSQIHSAWTLRKIETYNDNTNDNLILLRAIKKSNSNIIEIMSLHGKLLIFTINNII